METVLHIQNINKHYPGFSLENASFSLAPDRIMGAHRIHDEQLWRRGYPDGGLWH